MHLQQGLDLPAHLKQWPQQNTQTKYMKKNSFEDTEH